MKKKKRLMPGVLLLMLMAVVSVFGTVTALSENDVIHPEGTPLYYLDLSRFYAKKTFELPPVTLTTPSDVFVPEAEEPQVVHPPETAPFSEEQQQRLSDIVKKYTCVSAQVALIDDGYVTRVFSCGDANTRTHVPVNDDTKIRVASLSKVMVGMTAMAMQEDGLFDLDDPLTDTVGFRVQNPDYSKYVLTMRSFLTHTSTVNMTAQITGVPLDTFLRRRESYFKAEPNTARAWCYSNPGIRAAGGMLEVIAGRTLPDYEDERFFEPLGIDASFFASMLDDKENIATLYSGDRKESQSVKTLLGREYSTDLGSNAYIYAGGLMISAQDYARLMCVLLRDGEYDGTQILSRLSVAEMEQTNFELDEFDQCVVLRHREGMYDGRELFYHTGDAYGVFAFASYDKAAGEGVVVTTVGAGCGRDKFDVPTVCGDIADYLYCEVLDGKSA